MSTLRGPIIQHKQGIQLRYGGYYDTKQHIIIPIFFWISINVSVQSFPNLVLKISDYVSWVRLL